MKKSLICTALIIFGLTSFSIAEEKVELLPEVKELITPKPLDPKLLENSYSVGLLGLLYPTDDYYEVAKQTVKTNYEILMDPKSSKPLRLMKDQLPEEQVMLAWSENTNQLHNDLLLCAEYMAPNCVAKTIQSRDNIKQLIKDNQKLLERYNDIVKNSDKYTDLFLLIDHVDFLYGKNFYGFTRLTLERVILQLQKQQFNQAIVDLQQVEKHLQLSLSDEDNMSLLIHMLGLAYRSYLDLYLNAILDSSLLNNELNNSDVFELFQPYPDKYRKSIIKSIEAEQNWGLNARIKDSNYTLSNEALNQSYLFSQRIIKFVKKNSFLDQKERLIKECETLKAQYGEICNVFAIEDYLARYDTQSNYHNMVYLKYLILRDDIQDEDIPEFLKAQGDIAIDPITQAPFQWNTETRVISIPLPESKYLPSQIRMAVMENPDIKNLQVTIPKRDSK